MSKKGFDLPRGSTYVAKPEELSIIGGACLSPAERGELDTDDPPSHDLFDETLFEPLDPAFVENVAYYGVKVPIQIAKVNDQPTVIAGRSRVRAARVVNARRRAAGEPELSINCTVERTPENQTATMILENAARRKDMSINSKVAKVKKQIARGVGLPDIARMFAVQVNTVEQWLALDDNATDAVKTAVATGEITPSAAQQIARVEPEAQQEALQTLKAEPGKRNVHAAKKAAKKAQAKRNGKQRNADEDAAGWVEGVGIHSRRLLSKIHAQAGKVKLPSHTKPETEAWWEGVDAALDMILGNHLAPELAKLIERALAPQPEEKKP